MKKICLSLLTLATLLASCQTEEMEDHLLPTIIAEFESQTGTRTLLSVDDSGIGTIYWKPDDLIDIFFGTARAVYSSQNTVNARTASFRTSDSVSGADLSSANIWGLYPSDDSSTCDGNSVTTTLPSQQYGIPETFDDDLFLTLAHSNSTTLQFYNVCSGITFSLSRDDIKSISLKGNNNEDLAGQIILSFSEGLPKASVVNGVKEITLLPKSGQSFSQGVNYYLVTLPTYLSNGFTITFTTLGGSVGTLDYTDKPVTLKRAIFSKKDQIDSFATFEGESQPNNVIYYTSDDGRIISPYEPDKNDGFIIDRRVISNVYVNGRGIITFQPSIYSIGYMAFGRISNSRYSNLTSIIIPNSVTRIEYEAFYYCSKLFSISIPDSVTRIDGRAFYYCSKLASIEIPNAITSIGFESFYGCTSLSSVTIFAKTPPSIGNAVFDKTNDCPIYVPAESVNAYKSASGWSEYAHRIFPIAPSSVDLSKYGTANCYLAPKNGTYSFNASVKGNSTSSIGVTTAAQVVWETFNTSVIPNKGDVVTDVEFIGGRIYFKTTNYEGNALIAAMDKDGIILWSWHIWVTDYTPETDYDTYVGYEGIKVMDRNLGALSDQPGPKSFGLFYQWGRKEPFMGTINKSGFASTANTKTVTTSSATGTDSYAIQNPATFIKASRQGGDWRYVSDVSAWNSSKTELDPCPNGWKVPDGGADGLWKNFIISNSSTWRFDKNNQGMLFGSDFAYSDVWMPAQGYRTDIGYSLSQVGVEGRYWTSSSFSNQYSDFFEFKTGSTKISHIDQVSACSRANGAAIRCVEDK